MINIYEDLASLGLPVYQQGSAPKTLPESFYTVWNDDTSDIVAADNDGRLMVYEWTLIFYTKDYNTIYSGIAQAKAALKAKGYIISGNGYDFGGAYEEWQARGLDVKKIEKI